MARAVVAKAHVQGDRLRASMFRVRVRLQCFSLKEATVAVTPRKGLAMASTGVQSISVKARTR